jgi:hypothetical protein
MNFLAAVVLCVIAQPQSDALKPADSHAEVQAKLVALQAEGQPEGDNAYDTLLEIRAAVERADDKEPGKGNVRLYALLHPQGWKADDVKRARRVFDKIRSTDIERLIAKASDCPRLIRPLSTGLPIDNEFLDLVAFRHVVPIELLLAREDLAASKRGAWLDRIDRSLRLARLELADNVLVGYELGATISQKILEEAAIAVDSGKLDADALQQLRSIIRRHGPVPHTTKCLKGERLIGRDIIDWVYERDSQKRFEYVPKGQGPLDDGAPPSKDPPLPGWATHAEVIVEFNRVYDEFERLCAQPCFQWQGWDFREAYDQHGRFAVICAVLPAAMHDYLSTDVADLQYYGLDSMIALELYRAEHHRYPETIEELVPALLPEVPVDPFSGETLKYGAAPAGKLLAGNRPYVLYAWGRDKKDDDGHVDPDHPWAAVTPDPEDAKGFDIMLNPARPSK